MRIRHLQRHGDETVQLPMTPMIDIVFLLLIFFIMTFKIVAPEGDFNVKMPLAAPSEGIPDPSQIPPIKIRLKAGPGGQLTSIGFGDWSLGNDFGQLRAKIRGIVGDQPGPAELENTEVEFDCDYNLRYEYVVEAITAVSGYIEGDQVIKTVEKIKFSPPRPPQ